MIKDHSADDLARLGWTRVVCMADCQPGDGDDLICPGCGGEYGECPCPGPTMDDHDYQVFNGVLYARPQESNHEQEAEN